MYAPKSPPNTFRRNKFSVQKGKDYYNLVDKPKSQSKSPKMNTRTPVSI